MSWPDELQRWAEDLLQDNDIRSALRRFSQCPGRIDDAIQSALCCAPALYGRLADADRTYAFFRGWMTWMARNRLIDEFRPMRRVQELGEGKLETISGEIDEAYLDRTETLQEVIAELPEDDQRLIRLRLEDRYTLEEIAAKGGVAVGTVHRRLRVLLHRVRTRMWELYADSIQERTEAT